MSTGVARWIMGAAIALVPLSCTVIADVPAPAGRDLDADTAAEDGIPAEAEADEHAEADVGDEADHDVVGDAETDAACSSVVPPVPAPLWPENGALTGSFRAPETFNTLRPRFRWRWSEDACGAATFDIQVDDSCMTPGFATCVFPSPEARGDAVSALEWRPPSSLPVSTTVPVGRRYYWRIRACRESTCSAWSAVRYLDAGRTAVDLNGDGYSDAVVGASMQDASAADEGNAFVYYGGPSGIPSTPDVTLDNPANQAGARFGISLASTGDVNADGFADLLVGAYLQDAGAEDEGNAFLYYGGAGGIAGGPSVVLDNPANQAGGQFAGSVASAGDVNADGFADVIIGAPQQDAGAEDEGNAFVYRGSSSGISPIPSFTLDSPKNQAQAYFGGACGSAGDVNGDGFSDVLVGAPFEDAVGANEGAAYLYLGGAEGLDDSPSAELHDPEGQLGANFGNAVAHGDANDDGYSDILVAAYLRNAGATDEGNVFLYAGGPSGPAVSPSITFDNPANQPDGRLGGGRGVAAGDLTGDGLPDIVIGAYYQDAGATDEGNVFIYYATSAGVPSAPSLTLDSPANQERAYFGMAVAVGGDLNGDGFGDLLVGAYQQDVYGTDDGAAFVWYGGEGGVPAVPSSSLDNPARQSEGYFGSPVVRLDGVNFDFLVDPFEIMPVCPANRHPWPPGGSMHWQRPDEAVAAVGAASAVDPSERKESTS